MPDEPSSAVGGLDSDLLARIHQRLRGSERFATVDQQPPYAPTAVVAEFDTGYFPTGVERAYLHLRWFETDDFSIQYVEKYRDDETWACRWDRHPNSHNDREHFHPPPDAATPGSDADFATDWRTVLARILSEIDDRIHSFWE